MRISKTFSKPLKIIIWISLVLSVSYATQAQVMTSEFPNIEGYENLDITFDEDFTISDGVLFTFGCESLSGTCGVWDRATDATTILAEEGGFKTYWSIDNAQIMTRNENHSCDAAAGEYGLSIFHTLTQTLTYACLPTAFYTVDWSPLQPEIASIYLDDYYLLNMLDFHLTAYTPTITIHQTDLINLVGYKDYLWDSTTGLPAAKLNLNEQQADDGQITQAVMEACTFQSEACIPLVDMLRVSHGASFGSILNGHWLLWGVQESESGLPNRNAVLNPLLRSDTVLYLTDIWTGESRQLLRFSDLRRDDVVVADFIWSPDAQTIALSLESYDTTVLAVNQVINHPLGGRPGILLIKLSWPEAAASE